jgi:hypothetical protein
MSENLAISARTTRLNSLILGRPEALKNPQKEICAGINRDGLLDALFVLYDECSKDAVKKKSKHIQDFTNKCELKFAGSSVSDTLFRFRLTNCSGNEAVTS